MRFFIAKKKQKRNYSSEKKKQFISKYCNDMKRQAEFTTKIYVNEHGSNVLAQFFFLFLSPFLWWFYTWYILDSLVILLMWHHPFFRLFIRLSIKFDWYRWRRRRKIHRYVVNEQQMDIFQIFLFIIFFSVIDKRFHAICRMKKIKWFSIHFINKVVFIY